MKTKTKTKTKKTTKRSTRNRTSTELTARERQLYFEELLVARTAYQLEAALAKTGMTQRGLAQALGISEAAVSQVFDAESNLTLRTLARYAAAMDCEVTVAIENRASLPRVLTRPVDDHQLLLVSAVDDSPVVFLQQDEPQKWNVIEMARYAPEVNWERDAANEDQYAAA